MTKLNIIIPSLGNKVNIENLLNSIKRLDIADMQLSVFIILNGVDVDLAEEIRRFELSYSFSVRVECIDLRGVNRARNRGIDLSKEADLLFFLDDDCEFADRSILQRHASMHRRFDKIMAFGGGYTIDESGKLFDRIYNEIQMTWLFSGFKDGGEAGLQLTNHLIGGNFSIKNLLMNESRLRFDEEIVYGGSEHEFFKRALRGQLQMAYLEADVIHHTSETLSSMLRKIYKQGRGKAQIDSKFDQTEAESGSEAHEFGRGGFVARVFRSFFNYWFWFGYYSFDGQGFKILFHICRDLFNYLNFKRYEWLKKISKD